MFYIYIISLKYLFILHRNHFLRLRIRLYVRICTIVWIALE
jgi:hypothetical protein